MKLRDLTPEQYRCTFPTPPTVYDSVDFALLNDSDTDARMRFLACMHNERAALGLIAADDGSVLRAPFSAPYACPAIPRPLLPSLLGEAIEALRDTGREVRLTLPPAIYNEHIIGALVPLLSTQPGATTVCELNYHYFLPMVMSYADRLTTTEAKKWRRAQRTAWTLSECDLPRAYAVIARNRAERGYRLSMSLEKMLATAAVTETRCWVLACKEFGDCAAAIVNRAAAGYAHVVYWGHDTAADKAYPMSVLPKMLFETLLRSGFTVADIGPALDADGGLNAGLADYKYSIGCTAAPRVRVTLSSKG